MSRSDALLEAACAVIPGGVNSPVRAFKAVGGNPRFIARGQGVTLWDEDDMAYLDCVCSWGAIPLGHAHPDVVSAIHEAARLGTSFGAPTAGEVLLAEAICGRLPSVERVRLCSSGTEATMHAIRLARGVTGRDLIVKMDGCYHGAHDALLVGAGSGVATFAIPGSPGIPTSVAALTLVIPYNDLDAAEAVFRAHKDRIAAVILEPVAGNMGCIPPLPGYLQGLRDLTDSAGSLLIFDEVMCGFRVGYGSAQERYEVSPDLTTMGKIVGGGLPLAAFGGRAEWMDQLAPEGPIYQAGTLSGNPLAVAAARATLNLLTPSVYARWEAIGQQVEEGFLKPAAEQGLSFHRVGSMWTLFFCEQAPDDFEAVKRCDLDRFARFFQAALREGIYLPASQFEAVFLSAAMSDVQTEELVGGLRRALSS
jgi:glutamate-1-semialdehyde 2,1-aminomutase